MSSRISCWLRGHTWNPAGTAVWSDIFDNLWRIQTCSQCNASRRILHRRWDERRPMTSPPPPPFEHRRTDDLSAALSPRGRVMKRGRTERETCALNGWGVGTRLAGNEGYGTTVIEITAIGESCLLAKVVEHAGMATPDRGEGLRTLTCREWTEVPAMTSPVCAWCHQPARGDASIDGQRYCHDGDSPTCYELAQWVNSSSQAPAPFLRRLISSRDPVLAQRARDEARRAYLSPQPPLVATEHTEHTEPTIRYRTIDDRTQVFNEFIATGIDIHLEAMGQAQWWASVRHRDGRMWFIELGAVNDRAKGYASCDLVDHGHPPAPVLESPREQDDRLAKALLALDSPASDFDQLTDFGRTKWRARAHRLNALLNERNPR